MMYTKESLLNLMEDLTQKRLNSENKDDIEAAEMMHELARLALIGLEKENPERPKLIL